MTDNMMKEKHWLDMEVISRHVLTRSMTDNMTKEKHWLNMEVKSYNIQVNYMSNQCFSFIILSVIDLVNIWRHLHV
jgi:hypothetical protein